MQLCATEGYLRVRRRRRRCPTGSAILFALALSSFCFAQTPSEVAPGGDTQARLEEAIALEKKGDDRAARKAYESLLPKFRAEKNQRGLARALNGLSLTASRQGEYGLAIAWARESVNAYRKLAERDGEAMAVNNLGVAELNAGDYLAARSHFEQALAIYQTADYPEREIEQLNNIGNSYYFQSRYIDAFVQYVDAMGRVERGAGEPWSARWHRLTTTNLAVLFQRLGRHERALDLYRRVQQSRQALSPNEEAQLYTNLGAMYRRLGDPVKALEIYRQAQDIFARRGYKGGQVGVLINTGIALALDFGDLAGALKSFTNALTLAEQTQSRREMMQARLHRGESLLRLDQMDSARQEFETTLARAKELGTTEEEWKALYGLGRIAERIGNTELATGYFYQSIARIESIRSRLQLSTLKADFLGDKRDVYDSLIELLLKSPDAVEVFELMERSRARLFQDRLQQPTQGANPLRTLKLRDVQGLLDHSTLLLELWASRRAVAVVWITRDESGIAHHPFLPGDQDEASALSRDLPNSPQEDWKVHSERLGKLLLTGVSPLTRPGIQHLVVVPDGIFNSLPFEALRADARSPLLIEQFDVSYLPSCSILSRDKSARRTWIHLPWNRQLMAFGDPIFSSRTDQKDFDVLPGEELRQRLPTSASEVQAIARLSSGWSEIHLGADDLKKYLLRGRLNDITLLHLSTHATADLENPERSRILFSSESKDGRPDYIFLREFYELDLRGVELATLSACDTERGKTTPGEGVEGFSRALLSAGSLATVTTLWRVDDQPATEFMKQFYYALAKGNSKAQALRLAKLKFLRSGSALEHPRYWAAFVLNGDGLHAVPRSFSWSVLLLAPAAALVLVGVMTRRHSKTQRVPRGTSTS
ncbi:MAG TPA: CHAT domain-containing tetratricopeptide repeat protein [Myxococcaceae bacterium]|nr:CHAT domain-containing tetratricopeptide repeat protein [Myxococcaceae bacterium]